jgi:predicted  nucleic acid-binding Zn-ribbon protein
MNPQELQKLKNTIDKVKAAFNDGENYAKMDELARVLSVFADSIRKMRVDFQTGDDTLKASIENQISAIETELKATEKKLSTLISTTSGKTLDEAYKALQKEISGVKQAISGIKPFDQSNLVAMIKEVENSIPDKLDPIEVRDSLESLSGEARLDYTAIKGIREQLDALEQKFLKANRVEGGARFFGRSLRIVDFSFDGDGNTTSFILPTTPSAKGLALWIFYQGQNLQVGEQYTLSDKTVTTLFTPDVGTKINGFLIY